MGTLNNKSGNQIRIDDSLHQLRTAMHHHTENEERGVNLSVLNVSRPGEFSRVESTLSRRLGGCCVCSCGCGGRGVCAVCVRCCAVRCGVEWRDKRSRENQHHAHMFYACGVGRGAGTHGDVLNVHTETRPMHTPLPSPPISHTQPHTATHNKQTRRHKDTKTQRQTYTHTQRSPAPATPDRPPERTRANTIQTTDTTNRHRYTGRRETRQDKTRKDEARQMHIYTHTYTYTYTHTHTYTSTCTHTFTQQNGEFGLWCHVRVMSGDVM